MLFSCSVRCEHNVISRFTYIMLPQCNFSPTPPSSSVASPSLAIFRQRIKSFLFRRSYPDLIL